MILTLEKNLWREHLDDLFCIAQSVDRSVVKHLGRELLHDGILPRGLSLHRLV